jgi:hypothetical protein
MMLREGVRQGLRFLKKAAKNLLADPPSSATPERRHGEPLWGGVPIRSRRRTLAVLPWIAAPPSGSSQ